MNSNIITNNIRIDKWNYMKMKTWAKGVSQHSEEIPTECKIGHFSYYYYGNFFKSNHVQHSYHQTESWAYLNIQTIPFENLNFKRLGKLCQYCLQSSIIQLILNISPLLKSYNSLSFILFSLFCIHCESILLPGSH